MWRLFFFFFLTYKTASAGRLMTSPAMPVVHTSARLMAPLMWPLSAAFM